jgi:lysophospholipase L1-like esterase
MTVVLLLVAGFFGAWWQAIGTPVAESRPISTGALRIAVFGDSLAFGWGTAHPARDGVVPRLALRFAALRPGSTLVNAAFPGSTIAEVEQRQFRRPTGPVQLVLVISGGNDVQRVSAPWTIASDEASLIDGLRARYPDASVWVTDLPDVSLRPSVPLWSRAPFGTLIALDNAAFVRAARAHGAHVLPLSAISREPEANRAPNVSSDGLHPSAAGYAKLTDALWPWFEAALRPDRSFEETRGQAPL